MTKEKGGAYMASKLPTYTLRIERELMDKLKYIADYNGRSANKEIEQLIIKHIQKFEREIDEIILVDEQTSTK